MPLLSLSDKDREIAFLAENLQAKSVHALLEAWAQIDDQLMRSAILNSGMRVFTASRRRKSIASRTRDACRIRSVVVQQRMRSKRLRIPGTDKTKLPRLASQDHPGAVQNV
jgi:hypothetical protein